MMMWFRWIVVALLLGASSQAHAAEFPLDRAPLPGGSRKDGDANRYVTSQTFTDVIDYYKRKFKNTGGIRWYTIINQPGVRAKHLRSLRNRSVWEGINIGEYGGRVHVYVLMRPDKK